MRAANRTMDDRRLLSIGYWIPSRRGGGGGGAMKVTTALLLGAKVVENLSVSPLANISTKDRSIPTSVGSGG